METFLSVALSNAIAAMLLAVVAFLSGRLLRRPAVTHGLWLLVLLKLLTPPLFRVPVHWPAPAVEETTADRSAEESVVEEVHIVVTDDPASGGREPPEQAAAPALGAGEEIHT